MCLPLVEAGSLYVALESLVLDDELHPLEEGGRDGGRLLPQQDVDGLGHRVAQLAVLADWVLATLGILAIRQTIWKRRETPGYGHYYALSTFSDWLVCTYIIRVCISLHSCAAYIHTHTYMKEI